MGLGGRLVGSFAHARYPTASRMKKPSEGSGSIEALSICSSPVQFVWGFHLTVAGGECCRHLRRDAPCPHSKFRTQETVHVVRPHLQL